MVEGHPNTVFAWSSSKYAAYRDLASSISWAPPVASIYFQLDSANPVDVHFISHDACGEWFQWPDKCSLGPCYKYSVNRSMWQSLSDAEKAKIRSDIVTYGKTNVIKDKLAGELPPWFDDDYEI